MSQQLESIRSVARNLEDECMLRVKEHNRIARCWTITFYCTGYTASILAGLSGVIALSGMNHGLAIGGILSFVVTALTVVQTFINPKERAREHQSAAVTFHGIADQLRHLHAVEAGFAKDPNELDNVLRALIEKKNSQQHLAPQVNVPINQISVGGKDEVIVFPNVAHLYRFIANKIRKAESSIDDITWGSRTEYRNKDEDDAYKDYVKAMADTCQSGLVSYREISSLTNLHYFDRAYKFVESNQYNYQLAYYDTSHVELPLMSYIIIDQKEVLLGFYRVPVFKDGEKQYLSITNPHVVALFIDYYAVLWQKADKLKEGRKIDKERLKKIRETLEQLEK